MQTIMVVNSKGGCGKTTLAANLASYYAGRVNTVLMDYDPQGSCMKWLSLRPEERPVIHGIAAYQKPTGVTRSWQLRAVAHAERVIVDAPPGLNGAALFEFVKQADTILIPVLPSPIDIHATAHFIQELLLAGKTRLNNKRVAVVANRVRENTQVFHKLERFLASLKLPFIAKLRDTQNYIRAAQEGIGIFEITPPSIVERDRQQWGSLLAWLEQEASAKEKSVTFLSDYAATKPLQGVA